MRRNKRSIPPRLLICKNVPRYESTFAFTEDTCLVSYMSHKNKCTVVMSTMHNKPNVGDSPKKLPEIISYHNATKGGVDTVNKMLSCYAYIILNAYIIFNAVKPNWKPRQKHVKRKCFLHNLAILLATKYIQQRTQTPRTTFSRSLISVLSTHDTADFGDNGPSGRKTTAIPNKRGRCYKCYHSGISKTKQTSFHCIVCNRPVCREIHAEFICSECIEQK